MRIKITPEDERCQYIVDKEKRKVVCVIHDTKRLLFDFIYDYDSQIALPISNDVMRMPNQFSGVATCAEGDEWNEQLGRDIAFARAKYKLDRSFFRRANNFINMLDKRIDRMYNEFNQYGEGVSRSHNGRVSRLEKKLGPDFVLYSKDKGN